MAAGDCVRIVHVVGNLNLGGGQKLTALVAVGMRRAGYDVSVVSLADEGAYGSYLRKNGVPVIPLKIRPGWGFARMWSMGWGLLKLWYLLLASRWDIVHTHMFRTSVAALVPARLGGARLFGTSHRIYYPLWQPLIERLISRWQEAIVVDSSAVRDILRRQTRIDVDRYAVIYNGIDPDEFTFAPDRVEARLRLELPPKALLVTCVAHLAPHKGQIQLLEAFARLEGSGQQAHLLLVGDGPLAAELRQRVTGLGLAGRVHMPGARDDLDTVLSASDVLVLPSTFEGFGIIQAEAMHFGLPVIATDRGGSTEVVVNGETGYLVPFGDVAALADRLRTLLADGRLRRSMGEAGKRRSDALFTQASMAAKYAQLYGLLGDAGFEDSA